MRTDDALLLDMLIAARKLERFTQGMRESDFPTNELVQSAVIRELQVLGEAARLYELLILGTSLTQTIDGDRKSFSQHHIDWQHPERNVYHVTEEFVVEKQGSHSTRRPDIVLFVNGIPWS